MLEIEILAETGPNPSTSKVYPAPYAPDMVLLLIFESSQSNVESESLYLNIQNVQVTMKQFKLARSAIADINDKETLPSWLDGFGLSA